MAISGATAGLANRKSNAYDKEGERVPPDIHLRLFEGDGRKLLERPVAADAAPAGKSQPTRLTYNPSNPILVAYAADLSVREIYLQHVFR